MTVITAQEYTLRPEALYPATLKEWSEEEGQYGPQIKFVFNLGQREDGSDDDKWLWAGLRLTPRTDLWAICKAFGLNPVLGQDFDTEVFNTLVGTKWSVLIKHVDTPAGPREKITEILPLAQSTPEKACVFPKCKATETSVYDGDGDPWCEEHAPK